MTEATRSQLMETGRRIFAEKGLEGARVDLIADGAGVNKALINYHFRGKRGLYEAVLADLFQLVAADLEEALGKLTDPAARLAAWPEILWDLLERHRDFAPLFARELLSGCLAFEEAGSESLKGAGRSFDLLASTLAEGREHRAIARAEPYSLNLLMLGGLLLARISGPLRERLSGLLPEDKLAGSDEAVVGLLRNFIERGLLGDAARDPSEG